MKNVYFDTASTTLKKPEKVFKAFSSYMKNIGASPGRSSYSKGVKASRELEKVREKTAGFFGVEDSSRIVFTLNCTEALNMVIKGFVKKGDTVLISSMEHNSVMRPINRLKETEGIEVLKVKSDKMGRMDIGDLKSKLSKNISLFIINHASNVTGVIQNLQKILEKASEYKIPVLLDAAQSAGIIPIDIRKLKIAFMAFSGHKSLMGPQGTGGLYISPLYSLHTLKEGGTGSYSEHEEQPEFMPDKYESGTLNSPGIFSLGRALDFIIETGFIRLIKKRIELGEYFLKNIKKINGIKLYSPVKMNENSGIFSFTVPSMMVSEVGRILNDRYGIMVRVGLHCSPSAHKSIGTFPGGTVRFSFGYFNEKEEIDYFINALKEIIK